VVAENIRNGGDLNPMVPGHRMMAIFGFCDIRRFTDATEVLQEEVMEFVNSIAKIVHMEVSLHGGSANKNIGDAFLLVWKLPTQLLQSNGMVNEDLALAASNLPKDKRNSVAYLADRALAAFVVIQVALKRSPRLKQFCMRDDIR
jgi:class 3 adenylate cyclase